MDIQQSGVPLKHYLALLCNFHFTPLCDLLRTIYLGMLKKLPEDLQGLSAEEVSRLFYELRRYQNELEIKNKELCHDLEQLQASCNKYIELYDFTPFGYVTLDRTALIQEINLAAADLIGVGKERLIGRRFGHYVAGECQEIFHGYLRQIFETDTRQKCELTLVREDGTPFDVHLEGVAVKNTEGKLSQCRIAINDISEHKRTKEVLKKVEKEKEIILDSQLEHVIYQNKEHQILWLNLAACESVGVAREELIGRYCYEIWPQYNKRCEDCPVALAMETGQRHEIEKTTPDGRTWFIRGYPVQDTNGQIVGGIEVTQDITTRVHAEEAFRKTHDELEIRVKERTAELAETNQELRQEIIDRKQAEEALRKSEENFRGLAEERVRLLEQIRGQFQLLQQILNTVPEGVLLLNTEGQVILANPVAKRALNLLNSEWTENPLTHLGHRPITELLIPSPEGLWHEMTIDTPETRYFEVIARPLEDSAKSEIWVMVIRDVTQEREIKQYIQQQEHLAAIGQLAAGIAHDFNNIMAVIVLYTHLLSQELAPKSHKWLKTIDKQAQRAVNLTQQILDFSRHAVLERQPLNLVPLLKEQAKLLKRTLPDNIKIELSYGPDEYTINADPARLQQVIMNLAFNARDTMPEGGKLYIGLERIRIGSCQKPPLPEMKPGEWICLKISETGAGIPPHVLPHIFEPFYTTKAPGQGSGLGLAQVYGIVKQHEGYIDVETRVGQGTTFTVYLPAGADRPTVVHSSKTQALLKGQGETILVVENNILTREALVDSLKLLNYQVMEAADGREALTILDRYGNEVALVLTDVAMPEMGGIALLHALKQWGLTTQVVILTDYLSEKELKQLREQGMKDWLPKASTLEQLAQVVARNLQRTEVPKVS